MDNFLTRSSKRKKASLLWKSAFEILPIEIVFLVKHPWLEQGISFMLRKKIANHSFQARSWNLWNISHSFNLLMHIVFVKFVLALRLINHTDHRGVFGRIRLLV